MKTHEKIKKLLDEKGRGSQSRLAELYDADKGFISRIVSGKQEIPKDKLVMTANFLGTTVDYLLNNDLNDGEKVIPLIGNASCETPLNKLLQWNTEYISALSDISVSSSYAVIATENNMSPTITDGEVVVCDTSKPPSNNTIVHYTFNGESGIKRVKYQDDGSIVLISDNPDYNLIVVPRESKTYLSCVRCMKVFKNI